MLIRFDLPKTSKRRREGFCFGSKQESGDGLQKDRTRKKVDYFGRRGRRPVVQDNNIELYRLDAEVDSIGGVLCNKKGEVFAQWASYESMRGQGLPKGYYGIPVDVVKESLQSYSSDNMMLGVSWNVIRSPTQQRKVFHRIWLLHWSRKIQGVVSWL